MQKITTIGDIHGLSDWKQIIINNPDSDLYIFMGDYFDSFHISITEQINNFLDIVEFKNSKPDNVILLMGNHDYHYTDYNDSTYSGFNDNLYYQINVKLKQLIKDNTIVMAHKINNYLFTHAGVTKTWCKNNNIDTSDIVNSLNDYLLFKPSVFNFQMGDKFSPYGDDITQGPLWVRPYSLFSDCLDYIHIVGHTQTNEVKQNIVDNIGYIQIDTIPSHQYINMFIDNDDSEIKIEKY